MSDFYLHLEHDSPETLAWVREQTAHARKMYAKMKSFGHSVFFFEQTEGGHQGQFDFHTPAEYYALMFSFFDRHLRR